MVHTPNGIQVTTNLRQICDLNYNRHSRFREEFFACFILREQKQPVGTQNWNRKDVHDDNLQQTVTWQKLIEQQAQT
jgi:hypothetical protein